MSASLRAPLLLAVVLAAGVLRAGEKHGAAYDIVADVTGVSGRAGLASDGGWRLDQTVGAPVAGAAMTSPSGFAVSPGLWGGIVFQPSGGRNTILFGDPARPARLELPPDAVPTDYVVFAGTSPATRPLAASAAAVRQATDGLAAVYTRFTRPLDDHLWEIVVLDAGGRRFADRLRVPATLTLPYRDDDGDGLVDGTVPPVRADNLSVWWLDEDHALWVRLPDARVDRAARAVSTPIRHFSVFTVMGVPSFQTGDAYAFPVPWRPAGPAAGTGAGQTGTLADGITFTNLPSLAVLRVYTLSGALVREIEHTDGTAQAVWDVRTAAGEDVETGTYLYVIESNGAHKTGKLVVIR